MFNIFRKKSKIELENIKNYKEAIKAIKYFIATLEFEKARKAIDEIFNKELKDYKDIISKLEEAGNNIKIKEEKEKLSKAFSKKQQELNKLKAKLEEKEYQYKQKLENQRLKIKIKTIKNKVEALLKKGETNEALSLINNLLKENPGNNLVIKFHNKEKKLILKQIEKQKILEEKKLKQNAKLEALKLIGNTVNIEENNNKSQNTIFNKIKNKINFYKRIKQKIKQKKLLDEINILLEEEDKVKQEIAKAKLENIHKGLIKEISRSNIIGYTLYGKILGAHKISGDTFGFTENKKYYRFFIGDATGHGIKAGFIITLLTRLFNKYYNKDDFRELIQKINNELKQDLKSMNFITSIFFQIKKEDINKVYYVGMGHEPILIYKSKEKKVEKLIPGGLAAGIRIIQNKELVITKEIELDNQDIILSYSDGLIEAKNKNGEYYGLKRLQEEFFKISSLTQNLNKIYKYLLDDVKKFRGGTKFDDDLTIILLKRDINKDIIKTDKDKEKILEEIGEKDKLTKKEIKKIKGKTKEEIIKEIQELRREKKIQTIIRQLEQLWLTGEILKLKEEAKRYIKQGFIHPKINYYLKKAIENQEKYKISLKEEKLKNKYNILKELLKKGDYETVIKEAEEIIARDGNI